MKTKILLTAFTVISILAADKTFAQYNDRDHSAYNNNQGAYDKGHDHGAYNNGYNAYDKDHDRYDNREYYANPRQQEVRSDIREMRRDQSDIFYDQKRIEEKKFEMQRDLAHFNWAAYRQDQFQLEILYRNLEKDRNDVYRDHRDMRFDRRF